MAMFWSKKPKAEKIYDKGTVGAKAVQKKDAKTAKVMKTAGTSTSKEIVAAKNSVPALPSGSFTNVADAIIRPRVTEKSGLQSQMGVYTFEVSANANKQGIAAAVRALYKVNPVKVAIVNLPAKNIFVRGRTGRVAGIRKAMVTVKKGEKIDFV